MSPLLYMPQLLLSPGQFSQLVLLLDLEKLAQMLAMSLEPNPLLDQPAKLLVLVLLVKLQRVLKLLDIDLNLQRVMTLEFKLLPLVQTDNHYLLGLGGGFAPSAGRYFIYLIYSINSR